MHCNVLPGRRRVMSVATFHIVLLPLFQPELHVWGLYVHSCENLNYTINGNTGRM